MVELQKPAPDFSLENQDGKKISLKDFVGKWVVLYAYPKDDTPGCTIEAKDFSRLAPEFEKLNAHIIGISADSTQSHCKFRDKYGLTIDLVSDPDRNVLNAFGYQKRTTWLIDQSGKIAYVWNNVKVDGHAEAVKTMIEGLIKSKENGE